MDEKPILDYASPPERKKKNGRLIAFLIVLGLLSFPICLGIAISMGLRPVMPPPRSPVEFIMLWLPRVGGILTLATVVFLFYLMMRKIFEKNSL